MRNDPAEKAMSDLKCIGTLLIVLGIVSLPSFYMAIPAIAAGSLVTCCREGDDVASMQRQLGCVRCWIYAGVAMTVVGLIGSTALGIHLITFTDGSCTLATGLHSVACLSPPPQSPPPPSSALGRALAGIADAPSSPPSPPLPSGYQLARAHCEVRCGLSGVWHGTLP